MKFLIADSSLSTFEKVEIGFSYFLQLTLIGAIIIAFFQQNWLEAFAVAGILILTLAPAISRRRYKFRFPVELDLAVILMVYAGIFLGEVHGYYSLFWWWDGLLHAISGVLLGITGFLLVYVLNTSEKINLNLRPSFVAIFSVGFAVTLGVIWEIFEFAMDYFLGTNLQESGLVDTMWDLILDLLGALLAAILGFVYLRKERHLVENLVLRFLKIKTKYKKKIKRDKR